jgi:hypothetical protein
MAVQESVMQAGAQGEKIAVLSEFAPISGTVPALAQLLSEMRMKNLEAVQKLSKSRKVSTESASATV